MQIIRKNLWTLMLVLLPFMVVAQQQESRGYEIAVDIEGLANSDLYLGFHYGNRQAVKDTIRLNSNGHGVFSGNKALDQGIYLVITPNKNYFEILIGEDQHFSLSTNTNDLMPSLSFEGSRINEAFHEYQLFMMEMTQKKKALQKKIQAASGSNDSTRIWKERLSTINNRVEDKWETLTSENQGTILDVIIRAMKPFSMPEFNVPASAPNKDSLRWAKRYHYYKTHYFDNIDLSDPRLVRTPILHNKLDQYFNNILVPRPDSLIERADWVINQTRGSEDNFQYVVRYLLNHFQKSNIMGMDKAFVHIAEKYYLSGQADWVDQATLSRIRDRVKRLKPNLIGKRAPHLELVSTNGKQYDLYDLNSQYTLLYFWEPSCSHCKKATPKIYALYQKYSRAQFRVFAIYTQNDREEWKNYLNKNNLDWTNVYDPNRTSNFRQKYDVYSTPTMYLLDKDKTIIAKRIGHETLKKMLENKLGN